MSLESWFNWFGNREEKVERPKPIVWMDEPVHRRPNPPPSPPPIKRPWDMKKHEPDSDLLTAIKMLSRDTIDFLRFNDCGHTEEGLRERHETLVELIEEIEQS